MENIGLGELLVVIVFGVVIYGIYKIIKKVFLKKKVRTVKRIKNDTEKII